MKYHIHNIKIDKDNETNILREALKIATKNIHIYMSYIGDEKELLTTLLNKESYKEFVENKTFKITEEKTLYLTLPHTLSNITEDDLIIGLHPSYKNYKQYILKETNLLQNTKIYIPFIQKDFDEYIKENPESIEIT